MIIQDRERERERGRKRWKEGGREREGESRPFSKEDYFAVSNLETIHVELNKSYWKKRKRRKNKLWTASQFNKINQSKKISSSAG